MRVAAASAAILLLPRPAAAAAAADAPHRAAGMGMHLHDLQDAPALAKLHLSFLRLWDSGTSWAALQPQRDQWAFGPLDRYVDWARGANVELVMVLGQTPTWASTDPTRRGPYGPGASAPPRDLADWRGYVGALAQRYAGRIRYWEVWNEANDPKAYSGTNDQLLALTTAAREVLKKADARNQLLSPSIQGGALKEFRGLAQAGILKACDIASYHFYAPKGTPELAYQRMGQARQILQDAGLGGMPLWNTEVGWLNRVAPGAGRGGGVPAWADGWRQLDETELAAFVLRTALLSRAAGIPVVIWYGWDNAATGFGGVDRGAGSTKAIEAFNVAADLVMKAREVRVSHDDAVWHAAILQADGAPLQAWWREEGSGDLQVPADLAVAPATSALRADLAADARKVPLGAMPVFLRGRT